MNLLLLKNGDEEFFVIQGQMYFAMIFIVGVFFFRDTEFILNIISTLNTKVYDIPLYIQLLLALPFSIFLSFLISYFKSKRKKRIFDFVRELFLVILLPLLFLATFVLYLNMLSQ